MRPDADAASDLLGTSRLAFRLTEVRKSGEVPLPAPDGKTQVTIEYDDDDKPVRLDTVLISTQHDPEVTQD